MSNDVCPECKHVTMWSVGKLKRRLFRKRKNHRSRVKFWYCSVGEGEHWDVKFCGCKNEAHNQYH